MKKMTRRRFMKETMVMGSGMIALPSFLLCNTQAEQQSIKPANKIVTHPNVDNLRVVSLADPSMTIDQIPVSTWMDQEEVVAKDNVWENIDKLACGLAETGDPGEAWRAIFLKPPEKSWGDTIVAVKTNHIAQQHTRSAVMSKICHTLTGILGVKPANIHIYDACHGRTLSMDTPFKGLPDGCRIENTWGGSTTPTPVPAPWKNGTEKARCVKHLVNGSVDILINISVCKGHSAKFGGFTMTMKNHFGTFSPREAHGGGSEADYIYAINRTPEILGEMDQETGKVLFPRQQLCLVDALWASKQGPQGNPSAQPNVLAMGVLSPVVDYQLATKFRGLKMGWKPEMVGTNRMLTEFGYRKEDLPNGGELIEIS
jgi:hypothetical protein